MDFEVCFQDFKACWIWKPLKGREDWGGGGEAFRGPVETHCPNIHAWEEAHSSLAEATMLQKEPKKTAKAKQVCVIVC